MSFTVNGRQFKRSTNTIYRKLAEKIYAKTLTLIVEGKFFDIDEASRHTFDELMERYTEYCHIHKAKSTCKNIPAYRRRLLETFGGKLLSQLTPELIAAYRDKRLKEGAAPQTVKLEISFLSHAINIAIQEWGWMKHNPCAMVKKPKTDNKIL